MKLWTECNDFPSGKNDDLVDATTLALARFRQGGFIRLPNDDEPDDIRQCLNRGEGKNSMPYKNPEDAKAYAVRNKDKIRAYRKAYRKANKEMLAAKHKEWQQANKETVNAINRSYRARNKEKTAAYQQEVERQ